MDINVLVSQIIDAWQNDLERDDESFASIAVQVTLDYLTDLQQVSSTVTMLYDHLSELYDASEDPIDRLKVNQARLDLRSALE